MKFLGLNLGLAVFNLSGCSRLIDQNFKFKSLNNEDLVLLDGFSYEIIRSFQDAINSKEAFGTNNDFTAFFKLDETKALLWVNHEGIDTKLIPDYNEQRKATGGSVITIEKKQGQWRFSDNQALQEKYNRRYDANSEVSFTGPVNFENAKGTLANCSGGITPWNTVLTCEENFDHFPDKYGWQDFTREHYGWVCEIDPYNKDSIISKHTALGRFAHENATVALTASNKLVVYMGDDKENEHIYKYVSNNSYKGNAGDLLSNGKLYVAKFKDDKSGTWELLSIENPKLKDHFDSQAELLIDTRKAAKILEATELNRPEDLEISPYDQNLFVALSINYSKFDLNGAIMKLSYDDHEDIEFNYDYFLKGGQEAGLSCPDNLCFDNLGNLWVATDIYEPSLPAYAGHETNGLFMIPLSGKDAGKPKRFASAPRGAEITGPSFSDDYQTIFFSVQHPDQDTRFNKSAVVAVKLS